MGRVKHNHLVAVVGRPNVGKSTLINRIFGERIAIVDDMPGVTRDRMYLQCEWSGHEFMMIDTGGLIFEDEDDINNSVQEQAWMAVDEADVILFVVDGKYGLHPTDKFIANALRQNHGKPVILAVNKVDDRGEDYTKTADFYELGLGEPHAISAIHSNNVGDLLDEVLKALQTRPEDTLDHEEGLRLAIVGKPNAGKSSIVNTLLDEGRMTVSNVPGTTRDAVDSLCTHEGEQYILVDTAGIRKKSKVRYGVERFSVVRAIKAMNRADVIVLVLDASEPVSEQDQRIAGMAHDLGKGVVIVVNKWDLIDDKSSSGMNAHADEVRRKLYFLNYAPILYTSTITKKRLRNLFEIAKGAAEENERRITTGLFNEVLNEVVAMTPPPARRGKRPKVSYGTQVSVRPPTFVLFSNHPKLIEDPYKRHIERKLRESFGFTGTPLRILVREDGKRKARGQQRKLSGK